MVSVSFLLPFPSGSVNEPLLMLRPLVLVCEVAKAAPFSADALSLPTPEVAFFAAAASNAKTNSSSHSSRQSQASTSRDSPVPPPGRLPPLLLLLPLLAPMPLSVVLLPIPLLPPSLWSKARPSSPWVLLLRAESEDVMLVSDEVADPEEGKVATLLDLELLTLTEAEETELLASLLRTYWGKAAACEADASVELPVSSALTDDDDDDDLADLVVDVDEVSLAIFWDLPLRREGVVLAPTLAKAASAPR